MPHFQSEMNIACDTMAEAVTSGRSKEEQTSNWHCPSLPSPFEHNPKATCPACLDLNYNSFEHIPEGIPLRNNSSANMRFHVSNLEDIRKSAQGGCELCSILYQGITFFWGEVREHEKEENDGRVIDEDDSVDENEKDDEGIQQIYLASRPRRPLWVLRTDLAGFPFGEYRTILEFYTDTGRTPINPDFGCAANVPSSLDLTRCITMLQGWLAECDTQHNACLAPLPKLPKRLVRVSNGMPQLVETKGLAYSRYVTLSHCWGTSRYQMTTNKGNLERRKLGIDWDEFPQIFKDAITVTRCIDCQWIWIDALCIIQDDEKDWREESAKMAEIYSNSSLNIAATSSPNSHGSFFSSRKCYGDYLDNWRKWPLKKMEFSGRLNSVNTGLFVRVGLQAGHRYLTDKALRRRSKAAPLLDRAWVFQERLLAPRIVHFGSSEIIWECNTSMKCECTGIFDYSCREDTHNASNTSMEVMAGGDKILMKGLKTRFADVCQDRASEQETFNLWHDIVQIYSSLRLTKISDRPYALVGLASRFFDKLQSDYFAGIWAADLPRALLWVSTVSYCADLQSPLPLAAPTWSWMSQCDIVEYKASTTLFALRWEEDFIADDRLQIHYPGTFCDWTEADPFGKITYGQIEITALIMRGSIREEYLDASNGYKPCRLDVGSSWTTFTPDCLPTDQLADDKVVLCLLIGSTTQSRHILLLDPRSECTHYMRIGIAKFPLALGSIFNDGEIKRVRIS